MSQAPSSFKAVWIFIGRSLNMYKSSSLIKVIFASAFAICLFSLEVYLKNHLSSFDKSYWILLIRDEFDPTDWLFEISLTTLSSLDWIIILLYRFWSKINPSNIFHNLTTKTEHFPKKRLYPSIHFHVPSRNAPSAVNKLIVVCITSSILR